jgi:hypothetical protein
MTIEDCEIFPPGTVIAIPHPAYQGGPAPIEDVFFTVTLRALPPEDVHEHTIIITYSGGETLDIECPGIYGGQAFLTVESVAIRTESGSSDIEDPPGNNNLPEMLSAPNPFRFSTRLEFQVDEDMAAMPVSIQVLDVTGRALRTLFEGLQSSGKHVITWDGQDGSGRPVANGVYFLQLRNGSDSMQQRVTVVR